MTPLQFPIVVSAKTASGDHGGIDCVFV